jgi:hypothetical protein
MVHYSSKKTVMVAFLVQIFFIFLCVGSVYAAQVDSAKKLPFNAPPSDIKLQNVPIVEKPMFKIAPSMAVRIPANLAERKAELNCNILGFHDQAMTRPIAGNQWHMNPASYSPPVPYPWYIHYKVMVKNTGTLKADNVVVRISFLNPTKPPQDFYKPVSLDPGETAVFPFWWGAFNPGMYYELVNRQVVISAVVDHTAKIAETNEGNNICSYAVMFVQ